MTTEPNSSDKPKPGDGEKPVVEPPPTDATTSVTTTPSPSAAVDTAVTAHAPAPALPPPDDGVLDSPWPLRADITLLCLLLVLSFFLGSFTAANSDLWSHLAIGKRYSEGKFDFGVDPYSWTTEATASKPAVYWVHHSWLYSWLVYGIYTLLGGAALVLTKAIIFTAAIAVLSRVGWNDTNRWFIVLCLVIAALAVSMRLLLQPIVVSFLFLAVTMWVLDRAGTFAFKREAGEPDRTHWLWYLPPLFALWANLDHYFIFGPILVGLCWGASALSAWYPTGELVPTKLLGMVFGVGLLACLLNPHHINVFQLPPELAYLLVGPLGIPLPHSIGAAGYTVSELAKTEGGSIWTVSPISPAYFESYLGWNVGGMAFFPLVVLGLAGFVMVGLIKQQPGAPALHPVRFVPWLVFAVLALAAYRLIPFFVLVAAPWTAMTMGEFLAWQHASAADDDDRRDRGLHLARLASLPFMLVLIYFAWPGWLNALGSGNDYGALRRVAWELRPDPSMKRAAEALHDVSAAGKIGNVYNNSLELGNYMPWYAPDVKFAMDTRLGLYAGQTPILERARRALLDADLPAADWQDLFKERKIDQVALAIPAGRFKEHITLTVRWWTNDRQWRQRFADTRVVVFSWAGLTSPWNPDDARRDLDRQAFGDVPPERRPPLDGTPLAPMPTVWSLYLEGVGSTPGSIHEGELQRARYDSFRIANMWMKQVAGVPDLYPNISTIVAVKSAIASGAGSPMSLASFVPLTYVRFRTISVSPFPDLGPPSLPILMMRNARRAVAENPKDPECYRFLVMATEFTRNHEDYWASPYRIPGLPAGLRDNIRTVQFLGALYQAVQLQPDNPQLNELIGNIYLQQNLPDFALDHFKQTYKVLEAPFAVGKYLPTDTKQREAVLKQYAAKINGIEKIVKSRLAKVHENVDAKMTPLDKVLFALNYKVQEIQPNGRFIDTPLGLGKKALEILLEIDPKTLTREEQVLYLRLRFDLLVSKVGNIEAAAANLKDENVRKSLPLGDLLTWDLMIAGALGDYATLDKSLLAYEKQLRESARRSGDDFREKRVLCLPAVFFNPLGHTHTALATALVLQSNVPFGVMAEAATQEVGVNNGLYNAMTLRGIFALEAGDTKRARPIFEEALKQAGDEHHFSDRRMAARYLELLKAQGH